MNSHQFSLVLLNIIAASSCFGLETIEFSRVLFLSCMSNQASSVRSIFLTYLFHESFIKIEKFRYFSGGRQIYLTLLAWLLIQDKKSTRLNSIVSSLKQLLPAILFNKTRLHWCEFIGYILDSHSFSTKNKSKLHLFSI